jgi:predicted metallo-beta-lactamase superfamily hydrolase
MQEDTHERATMTTEIFERLTELKAKKTTKTITPTEKVELEGLALRQRRMKLAQQEAAHAVNRRKLDNQLRYKLGGMVISAGLSHWDEASLLGALIEVATTTDASKLQKWRDAGGRAYNAAIQERKRSLSALVVEFLDPPPEPVRVALRAKGLEWDDEGGQWFGQGIKPEIEAIVAAAGGAVRAAIT